MKQFLSTRLGRTICSTFLFALLVCLLHNYPLNQIHGRSDAAIIVGFFGVLLLLISCGFGLKPLTIATIGGYVAALVLGMVFNTNGVDAGGGSTNNLWIIWLFSYWVFLGIGLVVSLALNYRKRKER
ncbi:hypothetical protein RFF05_08305 [Bengtsoniella intestinalis]|uniref:hypothetical protein n=1 Tax=Bengtsoniella intestinalis TaxID=3073143 RepID=UPI00391F104B